MDHQPRQHFDPVAGVVQVNVRPRPYQDKTRYQYVWLEEWSRRHFNLWTNRDDMEAILQVVEGDITGAHHLRWAFRDVSVHETLAAHIAANNYTPAEDSPEM